MLECILVVRCVHRYVKWNEEVLTWPWGSSMISKTNTGDADWNSWYMYVDYVTASAKLWTFKECERYLEDRQPFWRRERAGNII